jgi:hypothetical protein
MLLKENLVLHLMHQGKKNGKKFFSQRRKARKEEQIIRVIKSGL